MKLDGVPIQNLSLAQLRNSIGYVGQDVFLMDATIEENLLLGKDGLGEDRLQQALTAADAWQFTKALPDALQTSIGERGSGFLVGKGRD